MTSFKTALASLAFIGLGFAHGAVPVRASEAHIPAKVIAPLKAALFDIGSKRALTYYEAESDSCKVTVVISSKFSETAASEVAAVRFNTAVASGTSARIDTADGPSLNFACARGATTMMVQTIDRIAYAKPLN